MELVICFGLAILAFVLLVVCIVGLVTAPTPILVCILIAGVLLTQKSINKLAEPDINLMGEKEKHKVEKVQLASQPTVASQEKKGTIKSMVYRGSNYKPTMTTDKVKNIKRTITIQYRGAKLNNQNEKTIA